MDISLLTNATSPDYMSAVTQKTLLSVDTDESFDSVLSSAINMLNETNDLQNDSQSAKIQFALGEADNPHDMQIAAAKAYEALLSIDDLVFGLSIMDEDQRSKEIRRVWVVACVLQIGDQLRDVFRLPSICALE